MTIPKLYDGRNKTFFMGAYEGVRANALTAGFVTVPTALMRQGNFSEISTAIRNPLTGQPFPGNIIPQSQISSIARKLLEYYPAANRPGTASNLQANAASDDNVDQVLFRVDQNVGNKARLYFRYNWHDSFTNNIGVPPTPIPIQVVTQPRVNKNSLFTYTHTLRPNLYNDFRIGYHRIDFDTLNAFSVGGVPTAGRGSRHSRLQRRRPLQQSGHPDASTSAAFSGLGTGGTNWFQFDTTFQMSNVMAYNRGSHNVRFGVRPAADDDRPARGQRPSRTLRLHRRHHRLLGRRFHAGAAADGDSADRPDPGARRRLAQRLLRQRCLAGVTQPHAEPGPALRAEHAGADLRGTRLDAGRGPGDDHPGQFSRRRASSSPIRTTRTLRRGSAPPTGSARRRCCAPGFGIYYNPNQMNSFTFLTNNPPIAAVSTFSSDPANPTLSFASPTGVRGPGGHA